MLREDDLIEKLKKNEIIIYGAGFVAAQFAGVLDELGLWERVVAVVATEEGRAFRELKTLGIKKLRELYTNQLICIAVSEISKDQITVELDKYGYKNYIWVYPFCFDNMIGMPIIKNKRIKSKRLLQTHADEYALAIRVLAIEEYQKKNNLGFDIYIKAQSLHLSPKTAEERLRRFLYSIERWEEFGYDRSQTLKVTDMFEMIDGMHRLSMAFYFKEKDMYCDIYHTNSYPKYCNDCVRLTSNVIKQVELSTEEIHMLEECKLKIQKHILSM